MYTEPIEEDEIEEEEPFDILITRESFMAFQV